MFSYFGIILPLILYILLLISQNTNNKDANQPPNILLILVDDMGSTDASFNYWIILSNHYTNPICGPTRSAFISSRFAYKIGNPFPIRDTGHMLPKYHTFAHELQSRGYRNHFIGKYGIDSQYSRNIGTIIARI